MSDELKRLQAQVEAQSFLIEQLLDACIGAGLLDPAVVTRTFLAVRPSPTFVGSDGKAKRLLADELESWAEMLIDKHLPAGIELPAG